MGQDTNIDIDLGAMLLEKKLITKPQLKDAIEKHIVKGGYLSDCLIDNGYLADSDLTTCLTCQYGYCYLPLTSYSVDDAALQAIPANYIYDYCVFPIEKNDKLLTIVMADPTNQGVIEMLRRITRCEIIVFISTRTEIRKTIAKYYGQTCNSFELENFMGDQILIDDLFTKNVSSSTYIGPNRRKYRRLYSDLAIEYYAYPNIVKTKAINLSMGGVLFESNVAVPKGLQMVIDFRLTNQALLSGVVEVTRCESMKMINTVFGDDSRMFYFYEVGAFFNFLSKESQHALADFLKKRLSL